MTRPEGGDWVELCEPSKPVMWGWGGSKPCEGCSRTKAKRAFEGAILNTLATKLNV